MLKVLIKKQFYELFQSYFNDRKTGKRKKKGSTIAMIVLFSFLMLYVSFMFFGLSALLGDVLLVGTPVDNHWLYFGIMGILSILLGTFGSVFNTYSGLYQGKDNEMLLSMPIKPSIILLARMTGVIAMSALYSGIVWLPSIINFWRFAGLSALKVFSPLFLFVMLALFVTVLTCVLGWIVALISAKMKRKTILTVVISLAFFAAYYYACMRLNSIIMLIVSNAAAVGAAVKRWIYPVYQLGRGAAGNMGSLLIFTAMTGILFAILYTVLSRSFISLLTTKKGEKKAVYREQTVKAQSAKKALLNREIKRFLTCPVYMLNTGLGVVIALFMAVAALVKMDMIRSMAEEITMGMGMDPHLLMVFPMLIVMMIISMDAVSASSVSLEGKYLWIVRSMPVSTMDILDAKESMHVLVNGVPAVLTAIALGIVFRAEPYELMIIAVTVWMFVRFAADIGLMMDLLKTNLTWTSEMIPVKQGLPVLFSMLITSAVAIIPGIIYINLLKMIPVTYYLVFMLVVVTISVRLLRQWIRTKGVERFENL